MVKALRATYSNAVANLRKSVRGDSNGRIRMASSVNTVKLFPSIAGLEPRKNDLFHCAPPLLSPAQVGAAATKRKEVVVFFGGDVQAGSREMLQQPRNAIFEKEYSLESVTGKLSAAFSAAHVITVKPTLMRHGNTFSCYENFVESADQGCEISLQKSSISLKSQVPN